MQMTAIRVEQPADIARQNPPAQTNRLLDQPQRLVAIVARGACQSASSRNWRGLTAACKYPQCKSASMAWRWQRSPTMRTASCVIAQMARAAIDAQLGAHRVHAAGQIRQHLATIAPGRRPAQPRAFQQHHADPALGQLQRGGQPV